MSSRFVTSMLVVAAVGSSASCDLLTGSNSERVIGIIGWEDGAALPALGFEAERDCRFSQDVDPSCVLDAPDTVFAGEPFEVLVQTIGGGGGSCMRPDGAQVSTSPTTIEIVPYDLYFPSPVEWGCLEVAQWLPRTLELTFPEPGQAVLTLTGRVILVEGEPGADRREYRLGSIDHPVVVR